MLQVIVEQKNPKVPEKLKSNGNLKARYGYIIHQHMCVLEVKYLVDYI